MGHINIQCEVHIPDNVAQELRQAIFAVNDLLPDEYEIVSIKTRGGVVVKKEDLPSRASGGINLG